MTESTIEKRRPPAAGKGKKPGTVNKTTKLLKEAILQAAENAGGRDGLIGYLTTQAKKNPKAFMTLLGRVLPLQVAMDVNMNLAERLARAKQRDD